VNTNSFKFIAKANEHEAVIVSTIRRALVEMRLLAIIGSGFAGSCVQVRLLVGVDFSGVLPVYGVSHSSWSRSVRM
jgi:hypothetical protein